MGACYNSTVVDASLEDVWEVIRDFHDLEWAEGVVKDIEVVGEASGDQVGAQRILNGVFHETLLGMSEIDMSIQYSIDDGPGPLAEDDVDNYIGSIQLSPVTDTDCTFVEWSCNYESADDEAVGEFCNPIYQALLGALKKHFED
ncbi:MAG: hypothetical protein DHS20C11_27050 [Lysobacteraceae bacterium]|nr:MAG: hypothetical protein DHS20C11_27050 [Xanthomonadaceae bacterium]